MTRRSIAARRDGFTLIEILLVVAILAILMGMVGAALLPMYSRAQSNATRTLTKKLDGVLMQHWSAAMKTAGNTPIPSQVSALAAGSSQPQKTARAIWNKLLMRAEFPMSYAEAINPWGGVGALNGVPVPQATMHYRKALGGRVAANDPKTEAAAMLLLSLQRPRDGRTFNAESELGASALRDTDGDGITEIVDLWSVPVSFSRWGTSNADLDAINKGTGSAQGRDKEDVEHALMDQNWHTSNNAAVQVFEALCHPIHAGTGTTYTPYSWYTEPVVVSAGRDKVLDLGPWLNVTGAGAGDNIYSFKQR